MPELIDTHVHLDDPRLAANLEEILTYAKLMQVTKVVNIGHDYQSSKASVRLAAERDSIWAAVGFHPHSASEFSASVSGRLEKLASAAKVVAVGEIGLDYHYNHSPAKVQREVFREQLALAAALDLPVVIHQRDAIDDALAILEAAAPFPRGGIMHCFTASQAVMRQCLDLGLSIGIGGAVTFAKAQLVKEVAAAVPLERLVLETDCPYMAPHPHRGKPNQPGYLPLIAAEIAGLRAMAIEQLVENCTENAKNIFHI